MKSELRVAVTALILVVSGSVAADSNKFHDETRSMQGSWMGTISIRNCVSGDVLAGPFQGLTTFHQGGTLSETREASPVNPRGPGHGIWYRTGKRQFAIKIVFQRFDLNGFLVGTQEILSTNEVSRDSKRLVTTATFKVLDKNGVTLASGCAGGESDRIRF